MTPKEAVITLGQLLNTYQSIGELQFRVDTEESLTRMASLKNRLEKKLKLANELDNKLRSFIMG